ncbi:hypothetical protein AB0G98_21085 [Streptomyces sp. NPDC020196]|uniref:hypothetical protein n=1 Tax=Streptomyces sp. NPDC020196 TaxID=3156656 RepID=UPI0033E40C75
MQPDEFPDLKMTHMDEAMLHMAELIGGLKKAGLSEDSAVRFAAIYFNEMSRNESDD